MADRKRVLDTVLLALLVILPIFAFYIVMATFGPQWDLMVRMLQGRTVLDALVNHVGLPTAVHWEGNNNLLYYFEPYREPLPIPFFTVLDAIFRNGVYAYIILMYILFLAAVYLLGRELKVDTLLMFSMFVNTFLIYFLFIPNGGEGLAIILVIAGIILLLRKSPWAGLCFGLAALAKYPALIAVPLVLLLDGNSKRLSALVLAAIPVLAWGVLDYFLWGQLFYSYIQSIYNSNVTAGATLIDPWSVISVIAYPVAFALVAIVALRLKRKPLRMPKLTYTYRIWACFAALAILSYVVMVPHNDPITQMRYGFLLCTALLLAALPIVQRAMREAPNVRYAIAGISLLTLVIGIYAAYAVPASNGQIWYNNPDNPGGLFAHAGSVLATLGYGQCRVISNAWVSMLYRGYDAYSPFAGYSNYPTVVFVYLGVPSYEMTNLANASVAYRDANFTVYLPPNALCYSYNGTAE